MRSERYQPLRKAVAFGLVAVLAACSTDPIGTGSPSLAEHTVFPAPAGKPAGRHVVQLGQGDVASLSAQLSPLGGKVERSIPKLGMYEISGLTNAQAVQLRKQAGIAAVAQDFRQQWVPSFSSAFRANAAAFGGGVKAQGTDQSGAFFYPVQWNIRQIKANTAWGTTTGGDGALVCVLDSGVDPDQLDLVGKVDLTKSASMVASEPFIEDLNFHGTFVSSVISSNGLGMASVAPNTKLCAVKVLDQTGSGSFFDILAGIVFAADVGADVINMSLRGVLDVSTGDGKAFLAFLQSVIDYARNKGALLIAATGNDAADLDLFPDFRIVPAQLGGVVGVSATAPFNQERFDSPAPYSNVGLKLVDIAAPGGDFQPGGVIEDLVLGACSRFVCGADGFYVFASGTSAAAPHVAAAGAVVESSLPGNQAEETLRGCLLNGADLLKIAKKLQGAGRLNVARAAVCGGL